LRLSADYYIGRGGIVIVTEAGQHKLEVAATWDPALPRLPFDAAGVEIEKLLRLDGLSRRMRRGIERLLREGPKHRLSSP
jgi:hypothetical protein